MKYIFEVWIIYTSLFACLLLSNVVNGQKELRTWTYTLIELGSETSNESLLKPDIHVKQLGRDSFVVEGSIWYNIDAGENTIVEFKAYRSPTGSSDYTLLPFQIPKQTFSEYLNTMYKTTIMDSLKSCSNMPWFSDKFEPPLEKKLYVFNNCAITPKGFPKYLPAGFYKMVFNGYHPAVNWTGFVISNVENDAL